MQKRGWAEAVWVLLWITPDRSARPRVVTGSRVSNIGLAIAMAPKTETVPVSEFARDHGVTPTSARNWIAEGMPYRNEPGGRRVVRAEANRWLREEIRCKALAEVSPSEVDERVRKTRIEADLKELELQERRRKLVPADTYQER